MPELLELKVDQSKQIAAQKWRLVWQGTIFGAPRQLL